MDYVETKNSRPDPKRNYTDICYLQILCLIRRLESSAEAGSFRSKRPPGRRPTSAIRGLAAAR